MKFLLDHDVPINIARVLKQDGHEVKLVKNVLTADATDERVFFWAIQNECILITCNRDDFLDLSKRREHHPGIIFLVRRRTRIAECASLISLLGRAGHSGLCGNINFA